MCLTDNELIGYLKPKSNFIRLTLYLKIIHFSIEINFALHTNICKILPAGKSLNHPQHSRIFTLTTIFI